jgi:hypothetical protein
MFFGNCPVVPSKVHDARALSCPIFYLPTVGRSRHRASLAQCQRQGASGLAYGYSPTCRRVAPSHRSTRQAIDHSAPTTAAHDASIASTDALEISVRNARMNAFDRAARRKQPKFPEQSHAPRPEACRSSTRLFDLATNRVSSSVDRVTRHPTHVRWGEAAPRDSSPLSMTPAPPLTTPRALRPRLQSARRPLPRPTPRPPRSRPLCSRPLWSRRCWLR